VSAETQQTQPARAAISEVMIVGTNRANAQGVLDALGRQSCPDDLLEIVVFDCADDSVPALQMPTRFTSKYPRRPDLHFWRVARAQAAKESSAPIVAFLEDHCEPHATWAERYSAIVPRRGRRFGPMWSRPLAG
jgi:hypothetical protein